VEPPVRIELTTFRLQGGCSTTELGRREASANYCRQYHAVVTNLGLTSQEARRRLAEYGENSLPGESRRSLFYIAITVLKEPMLLLLLAAGLISFLLADLSDAILLFVTVIIVLAISIYQHKRTESALRALHQLTAPLALVMRDGVKKRIPSAELVPGDLLLLLEGDRISADAKLLTSSFLEIDESLLTGESVPVSKEQADLIFSGTLIVRGHGSAEVLTTGSKTELGAIGESIKKLSFQRTRLQESIDRLVKIIGFLALIAILAIITIFGFGRDQWLEGLIAAIAAAMALIPEEFPVILTLFMALGAWRMAKVRVITQKPAAIEALGSVTTLCVDKTGTLTNNEMQVVEVTIDSEQLSIKEISSSGLSPRILEIAALATPDTPFDPMDHAIQKLVNLESIRAGHASVKEIPLEKSRLIYFHIWESEKLIAAAKGAPEHVGALCNLSTSDIESLNAQVAQAAERGLRVIAVAEGSKKSASVDLSSPEGFEFQFLGLLCLQDPIRDGVVQSVAECVSAGIRVLMITGDHPKTALALAREAGIADHQVLTGTELNTVDDSEIEILVRDCSVFARVRPEDKLRIIRALQANGEVVAMTGDGINDAPALKAADIGIAMGLRGTDVAREAAHLIITDDNFTSIVAGIKRGRAIYANIKKAMSYVIAIHIPIFGMALVPVFSSQWPLILLPALVAFHEVIIDPASSIVFEVEEPDPKIMSQKPRVPNSGIFSALDLSLAILQGLSIFIVVFGLFYQAQVSGVSEEEIRSLTFSALIFSNIFLILANRSRKLTIWESLIKRRNPAIPWIVLGAMSLLVILTNVAPLSSAFGLAPLELSSYFKTFAICYLSIIWLDALKFISRFKTRQ
jgi:P-type Ca2+ transporter type 2C